MSKNVSLVICPSCKGEGVKKIFNGDSYNTEKCNYCKGKRVMKQIITVTYEECEGV